MKIDLEESRQFLSALDSCHEFTFQAFPDSEKCRAKPVIFNDSFDKLSSRLVTLNEAGCGIFVTINRTDLKGRRAENIKAVRAVFLDLDGNALPEEWPIEPHLIVESSEGKWHVYWRVTDLLPDDFEGVQRSIAEKFGGDPAVHDLGRVMRIPGFIHQKKDPFLTQIVRDWSTDFPYPASQILSVFPAIKTVRQSFRGRHEEPDLLLELLTKKGMVLGRGREPGMYRITCPWHENHTSGTSGAVYWLPNYGGYFSGGFCCLHSHCVDRKIGDLKEFLSFRDERDIIASDLIEGMRRKKEEEVERKRSSPTIVPPESIIPETGIIRDISSYILETSIYPQPILAVAAATTFVGCLLGGKIASSSGLRTNLYSVALAPSGAGKEHAQKIIRQLVTDSGLDRHLGGDNIASGTAVFSALAKERRLLYLLDEFGLFLRAVMDERNHHKAEIMKNLMTAYSRSGSSWLGTDYANTKENPRVPILNPHLCLYGITTHQTFFDALSSTQGGDGSIARMIFFDLGEKSEQPKKQKNILFPPSPSLVSSLKDLAEISQKNGNLSPDPEILPFDPDVDRQFDKLEDYLRSVSTTTDTLRSIYNREIENTIKLSMIHAASCYRSSVSLESFEWASSICRWSTQTIVSQIDRHMADNETERSYKKILRIVENAGSIDMRSLKRRIRWMEPKRRDAFLSELVDSCQLVEETQKKEEGAGRPKTMFRIP